MAMKLLVKLLIYSLLPRIPSLRAESQQIGAMPDCGVFGGTVLHDASSPCSCEVHLNQNCGKFSFEKEFDPAELPEDCRCVTDHGKEKAMDCPRATLSDLDVRSLVLFHPNFTFLHSREFFIAASASCEPVDGLKPLQVPKSIEGKRARMAQRFKVKQVKEGLSSRSAFLKSAKQALQDMPADAEHAPIVELHMYPSDPLNATSPWVALLVPTVLDAFRPNQNWFLCQKAEHPSQQCVARLPFETLPGHFTTLLGTWEPHLDRVRSTPIAWVRLSEGLQVLSGALVILGILSLLWVAYRLFRGEKDRDADKTDSDESELLGQCCLMQHAFLYEHAGGDKLFADPLDAGTRVNILELQRCSEESLWTVLRQAEWRDLRRRLMGKPVLKTWGRVEEPAGWLLIHKVGEDARVMSAEKRPLALLRPDNKILPGPVLQLRRHMTVMAFFASGQWLLLAEFTKIYQWEVFLMLVFCIFGMYVAVVWQKEEAFRFAMHYQFLLEKGQLLRFPKKGQWIVGFGVLQALIVVLLVVQPPSEWSQHTLAFAWLLLVVAVHSKAMYDAVAGRWKWRQPCLRDCQMYPMVLEHMPSTSEPPTEISLTCQRRVRAAQLFASILSGLAMMLTSRIVLDTVCMRGELVSYSFSRGHLTYPAHSEAFHNTLLLDQNVDALTLELHPGEHTLGVLVKMDSPLTGEGVFQPLESMNESGEVQLALPAGPLYSRMVVLAIGAYFNTTYQVHVLRVGEAFELSLRSTFSPTTYPELKDAVFFEQRRLQYHLQNPLWYVPDVDLQQGQSRVQVDMTFIVFAPLGLNAEMEGAVLAPTCRCGPEAAGFGNQCAFERIMELNATPMCLYQRTAAPSLQPDERVAGVAGSDNGLMGWLHDVTFSGKSAVLSGKSFSAVRLEPHSTMNSFSVEIQLQALLGGGEILIASTQDPTSSEVLTVPVTVVAHAPPPSLHIERGRKKPSLSFLLPEFSPSERRSWYALCGSRSQLDHVHADVPDPRFEVRSLVLQNSEGFCGGIRKHFSTIRRNEPTCHPWCGHYRPWEDEAYDVSASHSVRECLKLAVELGNLTALEYTIKMAGSKKKRCLNEGWLVQAIQRNFSAAVTLLLSKSANASVVISGLTPLQVAAAHDNENVMEKVLNQADINQETEQGTALAVAGKHCRLEAMKFLLERHAAVASNGDCSHLPLFRIVTAYKSLIEPCQSRNLPNERKWEGAQVWKMVGLMQKYNASWFAKGKDCRGDALNKVMQRKDVPGIDVPAMHAILDRPEAHGPPFRADLGKPNFLQMLWDRFHKMERQDFEEALQLLLKHGANINDESTKLFPMAVSECDVQLLQMLLNLNADPNMPLRPGMGPLQIANKACASKPQGPEILKLLSSKK